MKVLTLHQPWASLVAAGVKTIETRSWRTHYRGPLAIHAGLAEPPRGMVGDYRVVGPARSPADAPWEMWVEKPDRRHVGQVLPFAHIVATVVLVDCVPMLDRKQLGGPQGDAAPDGPLVLIDGLSDHLWLYDTAPYDIEAQRPYGDYRAGRWAWLLEDIVPVVPPVPFTGGQSLSREWTP
jgi:hypothetical protein